MLHHPQQQRLTLSHLSVISHEAKKLVADKRACPNLQDILSCYSLQPSSLQPQTQPSPQPSPQPQQKQKQQQPQKIKLVVVYLPGMIANFVSCDDFTVFAFEGLIDPFATTLQQLHDAFVDHIRSQQQVYRYRTEKLWTSAKLPPPPQQPSPSTLHEFCSAEDDYVMVARGRVLNLRLQQNAQRLVADLGLFQPVEVVHLLPEPSLTSQPNKAALAAALLQDESRKGITHDVGVVHVTNVCCAPQAMFVAVSTYHTLRDFKLRTGAKYAYRFNVPLEGDAKLLHHELKVKDGNLVLIDTRVDWSSPSAI